MKLNDQQWTTVLHELCDRLSPGWRESQQVEQQQILTSVTEVLVPLLSALPERATAATLPALMPRFEELAREHFLRNLRQMMANRNMADEQLLEQLPPLLIQMQAARFMALALAVVEILPPVSDPKLEHMLKELDNFDPDSELKDLLGS